MNMLELQRVGLLSSLGHGVDERNILIDTARRAVAMMRASLDGLILTDAHGVILEINPAVQNIFGMPGEQLLGTNIRMLLPESLLSRSDIHIAADSNPPNAGAVEAGSELVLNRKSGAQFTAQVIVSEIPGLPEPCYVAMIHEITKRRQAEEELRKVNELLEQRIAERTSELTRLNDALLQEIAERKKAEMKLQELATTDALTQIFNRREFDRMLTLEFERSRRYATALSIVMFDVDHFKQINDTRGHLAGDQVLSALARFVSVCLRSSDIFARWGGEEFAILLPGVTRLQAYVLAEKLRSAIERTEFAGVSAITCSFGVCDNGHAISPHAMISCADALLYQSKRDGRNCVSLDEESMKSRVCPA